jgi:hypothetical protein
LFNCILLELYNRCEELGIDKHCSVYTLYCAFNSSNDLILYNCALNRDGDRNYYNFIICIYSLQLKDKKSMYKCKKMYWTSGNVISIQKDDKLYLSSSLLNNSVYEFNLFTGKKKKIVGSSEMITTMRDSNKVI